MWGKKGLKHKLPLWLLFSHLTRAVDLQAAWHPDEQHCAWVHSNLSLFQSQPRNCLSHILWGNETPKVRCTLALPVLDTLCIRTNRNQSFTPVWNYNSLRERLWKIRHFFKSYCNHLDIKLVFSSFKFGNLFGVKDPVLDGLRSCVV